MMCRARRLVLALTVALAAATPAAAQEPPPAQPPTAADTARTPAQRAMERLRGMSGVSQPDSARLAVDTVRAQQVNVQGATREAPPSQIERDSVMQLLLRVPGYVGTEYQGDSVRFQADINRLELRGRPQVAREGSQLVADSLIVYDEAISRACGYGKPVLHGSGMQNPLVSDTVCFDVERQVGYARGAQTSVSEGVTWNMRGDVYFQGDDLYSHRAIFTDCDLPWPHQHYHFGARELKVVRDNILVARDVTLNFEDVPVFWLPFMVQSLSEGRRSGLLMPRFGINDIARNSSRYNRRIEDIGFYWAVNDNLGAEAALDWFSNNYMAMRGSFDYNFTRRFLRGGLTYRYFWPEQGGSEFTLASQNSWQPDERTNVGVSANYVTSSRFVQQQSFDPRELNRSVDSNLSLSRRFDWGNVSTGATRRQQLSDNTVTLRPGVNVSFTPITLFEAMPGEDRWFSNMTVQGTTNAQMERTSIGDLNTNPNAQSRRNLSTGAQASVSVGRLSLGQSFSFNEDIRDERLFGDTLLLPAANVQRGGWNTSLSFQQRLVGTSTFTPTVGVGGEFVRSEETGNQMLHAPARVNVGAGVRADVFGFYGGVAAFDRFRHRLSPSLSWSYTPALQADSLQGVVFGPGAQEQNRLTIGLSQTWEARYRGDATEDAAAGDAATGQEGAASGDEQAGTSAGAAVQDPSAPRRQVRAQTVTLLSISTDALVYDFVRAREDGRGLTNTQISNSVTSDLLRGMQLRFTHELFRDPGTGTLPGEEVSGGSRAFSPHLSQVNASFSLNSDSWLFRVLGLGRSGSEAPAEGGEPLQDEEPNVGGPAVDMTRSEFGMVGTSRRTQVGGHSGPAGSWNAGISYTMFRPRSPLPGERGSQNISANVSFQPTENWRAVWTTGYAIGDGGFTDHILTLSRELHDWDANFDFVKAQNGNFTFQFRVHLRANPDIKVDYSQSDRPTFGQPGIF